MSAYEQEQFERAVREAVVALRPPSAGDAVAERVRDEVQRQREQLIEGASRASSSRSQSVSSGSLTDFERARDVAASRLRVANLVLLGLAVALVAGLTLGGIGLGSSIVPRAGSTADVVAGVIGGAIALLSDLGLAAPLRRGARRLLSTDASQRALEARRAEFSRGIDSLVSERVNAAFVRATGPSYAVELPPAEGPGQLELRDVAFVSTRSSRELAGLLADLEGASIGLAGPRGAGKTTLLRRACDGHLAADPSKHLGVIVAAPVRFDARDFLLHLTAELCHKVLGTPLGGDRPTVRSLERSRAMLRWTVTVLISGALIALGVLLVQGTLRHTPAQTIWGIAALAAGGVGVLLGYAALLPRLTGGRVRYAPGPYPLPEDLQRRARQLLDEIKFQQTFTSGWSGTLKLPIGLEGSYDTSASRVANAKSFPEVATMLADFLTLLATVRRIVIGIDELDKMESDEAARAFLNEIKVVFGLKDCFFLISVSEDAMGSFERRGMPFRDVFDSSLDTIQDVPYLEFEDSRRLLVERGFALPEQFTALCHCLGGGLPRDVIRAARALGALRTQPLTLVGITRELIDREIKGKRRAAMSTLRHVALEPELTRCLQWAHGEGSACDAPDPLLERCRRFPSVLGPTLSRVDPGRDAANAMRQVQTAVALELVALDYWAATMLQAFTDALDEARLEASMAAVRRLAVARQRFELAPSAAWTEVDAVRGLLGLSQIAFPEPEPRSHPLELAIDGADMVAELSTTAR